MSDFEIKYLTASDLAKRLNFSRQNIAYLIKTGKIFALKVNNRWRIPIKEVKRIEKEGI